MPLTNILEEIPAAAPKIADAAPAPAAAAPLDAPAAVLKPRIRLADIVDEDFTPPKPFTMDQTTMTLADNNTWQTAVETNGKSDMGQAILNTMNRWATLMEQKMAAGVDLTPAVRESLYGEADQEGLSGFMYGKGLNVLIHGWKYGDILK